MLTGCVRSGEWTSRFLMEGDELVSIGRNPYFILEPGYQLVLEGGGTQLIITVLNETKMVDGVETRVVEERETKNGQLIEVARNYFAISRRTNDVFYFEEDVDMYKNGKVVNHDGSWVSGVNGGTFELMMPGRPLANASYYPGGRPGGGDGSRHDRQHDRDRQDSGRRVHALFEDGGDDPVATVDGVQV